MTGKLLKKYFLGFDLGTTTSKGVITDSEGKVYADHVIEHAVARPEAGYAEHDAEKIWYGEFVEICRMLIKKAEINPEEIEGVGCSGLYPCVLTVDKQGIPLRPAILYGIDTRNLEEIDEMREKMGVDYSVAVSGNGITAQSIGPKILWIRKNEPEVFQKTGKYLFATSFLVFRLTGEYVLDHGSACLGGLPYDKNHLCWDARSLEFLGIRETNMPRLVWGTEVVGNVTEKAAQETGLAAGTKVIAGTGDHVAEVVSLGGIRKKTAVVSYGTTFGLDFCTDREIEKKGLQTCRTLKKELYLTGGGMRSGAALTKWFRDNLGHREVQEEIQGGTTAYAALSDAAAKISPGSDSLIALPYFSGECCPIVAPQAKGVLFGLTLQHTGAHIYRALLEGVAYGLRHVRDTIEKGGVCIEEALAVGGGTKSPVWPQIVSDITGIRQIILKNQYGSPRGSALMAAFGCGYLKSLDDIIQFNASAREVCPNEQNREVYQKGYDIYRSLYENTKELMKKI